MTRRLALVLLAVAAAQAAQYIVRPLTSYRLLALGAGAREVGLVTAAFALVPMLVAIPLGRLTDSRRSAPPSSPSPQRSSDLHRTSQRSRPPRRSSGSVISH